MMTDPFNEAAASRKELIADSDAEGRIDAWLTAALGAEFSRNRVKALIEQGAVRACKDVHANTRPDDLETYLAIQAALLCVAGQT